MQYLSRFEPLAMLLVVIGGLNWAIVALFDTNVVSELFGSGTLTDVVYVLVGLAALSYVPRLVAHMQEMSHHLRPHGA